MLWVDCDRDQGLPLPCRERPLNHADCYTQRTKEASNCHGSKHLPLRSLWWAGWRLLGCNGRQDEEESFADHLSPRSPLQPRSELEQLARSSWTGQRGGEESAVWEIVKEAVKNNQFDNHCCYLYFVMFYIWIFVFLSVFVSSDRSSYSDDVLVLVRRHQLFQILSISANI